MSDRLVSRDTIERLRNAARTRDWNQWEPELERAVAEVPPDILLTLTEAVLRDGLPTFERNHPGESWPRRALDGLETGLGPADYPGPGGNEFGVGVEYLVEARTRTNEPDACRRLIFDALCASIMASMVAAWGEDHPEQWKRRRQCLLEFRTPLSVEDGLNWSDDPRVQQIDIDGWNDLIDRIERLERPDAPEPAIPDDIPIGADPHEE